MEFDINRAKELSYISKLVGQDSRLVQAGGGNTSVKLDDRYMLVKASGCQLADVTETNGYSVVDYRYISDEFAKGEVDNSREQEILSNVLVSGTRPSIETFLHSITYKYTIHTHPLGVTMYVSRTDGMDALRNMFPNAVFVGYDTPGIKLAKEYYNAMMNITDKSIVFLKNHGLVVSGNSVREVVKLHRSVVKRIDESLGLDFKAVAVGQQVFEAIQTVQPQSVAYRVETNAVKEAVRKAGGGWNHAYSPDCVVYCGNKIATLSKDYAKELSDFCVRYGKVKAIVADGYAFAVSDTLKSAREIAEMLDFTAQVYLSDSSVTELPDKEKDFLLNWDSEKYRANYSK